MEDVAYTVMYTVTAPCILRTTVRQEEVQLRRRGKCCALKRIRSLNGLEVGSKVSATTDLAGICNRFNGN